MKKKKPSVRNPFAASLALGTHKPKVVQPKKGKGSKYKRKEKHNEIAVS